MDIRSILVAQDFSVCAQAALRTGIWLARLLGAELHQLHIQELHPDLAVTNEILRRISPREGILEYLETHPFDLLITGTHGRRGLR